MRLVQETEILRAFSSKSESHCLQFQGHMSWYISNEKKKTVEKPTESLKKKSCLWFWLQGVAYFLRVGFDLHPNIGSPPSIIKHTLCYYWLILHLNLFQGALTKTLCFQHQTWSILASSQHSKLSSCKPNPQRSRSVPTLKMKMRCSWLSLWVFWSTIISVTKIQPCRPLSESFEGVLSAGSTPWARPPDSFGSYVLSIQPRRRLWNPTSRRNAHPPPLLFHHTPVCTSPR